MKEMLRLSNEESNRITRESIQTALLSLMTTQDFDSISITALVKKAGVSRTAYYRNYYTKEDVLQDYLKELLDEMVASIISASAPDFQSQLLFLKMEQHQDTFRLLQKAHFGEIILEEITRKLTEIIPNEHVVERTRIIFWSGGLYNLVRDWLMGKEQLPTDLMIEYYEKMLLDLLHIRNE